MNVKIESLPEVTTLSGSDVLVVNKNGSFTGKITVDNLKQYIIQEVVNGLYYSADNVTIGLSANNAFYVKLNSITFNHLSPDLQDQLSAPINESGGSGSTLTGEVSTFATPLTATGDFLVVNLNNTYRALRVWSF